MTVVQNKLRIPAIGIMISAGFSGLTGAISLISGLLRFSGLNGKEVLPTDQGERIGYYFGTLTVYGIGVISLIVTPIIIFGAIRMLKGQNRGLALFAAILSILPFTSCCFLIGGIFGVWAVVVLMQSDVKSFFENGGES